MVGLLTQLYVCSVVYDTRDSVVKTLIESYILYLKRKPIYNNIKRHQD